MGLVFKASKTFGPLSPRQLLAKLLRFTDTFTAANSSTTLPVSTATPWEADKGVWGVISNKAYAVSLPGNYAVATVDTKTENVSVKSTTDNTHAGVGVSFWVTDANNWWGAHSKKVSTTGTPYICPSGGTLSGTNCNYTYGATASVNQTYYYFCPPGYFFHGICCQLNGHEWVGCIGPNHAPGPVTTTYSCPSGGSLSGTTCYASYAASLTTYYVHTLETVKSTAGSVSTVNSTTIANTTNNSDYVGFVRANTGVSSAVVTAQMTSGGAVASYTAPSGTPAKSKKHGMLAGPSTLNAGTTITTFDYDPL
jgi:hypothetical protein